ncbi:hypothetical protein NMG60_11004507 [Bertholletia excelsa]
MLLEEDGVSETVEELRKQVKLAGPLIIVSFLQYSLQMVSIMFVGHLGELSLSSASMAASFASVTGFSLMLGMGGALETFCGQAYGAGQYQMLSVHMQRAMLVLTLTSCQLRFLQAQNNIAPLIISTGVSSLIHVIMCWTLVFGFGFGENGAALSSAVSYWANVLMLAVCIKFSAACEKTWTGFSKEGMNNLLEFLSLSIPSGLMVCLEFWSYEFLVLMSGNLPNPKLETSMMSVRLASHLVYRIPFGLGSAVSTRVSNELGAGRARAARLAVKVVILLAVTGGLLVALISVAARDYWGFLFTNEEEVVKYFASVVPILATSGFMDGIQGVLSGVARGCGWQKLGTLVNLGAYYLVGLPRAITLGLLVHLGGKGLWMGIISGSGLQALLLLAISVHTDWGKR